MTLCHIRSAQLFALAAIIYHNLLSQPETIEAKREQRPINAAQSLAEQSQEQPITSQEQQQQHSAAGAAYLLLHDDQQLNSSDPIDALLAAILDGVGPDMKPSSSYRDLSNVSVEISRRAWSLMHDHAQKALIDRFKLIEPLIDEKLRRARVSAECRSASRAIVEASKGFQSWAVQCKYLYTVAISAACR